MIKDTDFFADIPHVKPDDRKVEPSNRPEDILVQKKVKLFDDIIRIYEGEVQKKEISFGIARNDYYKKGRARVEKTLLSDNRVIIKRCNLDDKKRFEIQHIEVPSELTDCENNKNCLTPEEIQSLNKWFLSSFWDKKVTMKLKKDPYEEGKKHRVFERDVVLDAKDILSASLTFELPDYIGNGYFSRLYRLGKGLGIGTPKDPREKTTVYASSDRFESFNLLDQAVIEGEKVYGKENPLTQNFYSEVIRPGAESKMVGYIENSKTLEDCLKEGNLSEKQALIIIRDIARGVSLLHKKREGGHWVTHEDLHEGNVLVVQDQNNKVVNSKIIDYSLLELDGDKNNDCV